MVSVFLRRELWTFIPPGVFWMGDPSLPYASPRHRVYLGGYFIARQPVTQAWYAHFVRTTAYPPPAAWLGDTYPALRGHYPVTGVSWRDAMAFCLWLQQATGLPLRLPTEAEWERAAWLVWQRLAHRRAGPALNTWEQRRFAPQPVHGHRDPLPQAMFGNVWEWCLDGYDPEAYAARGALTVHPLQRNGVMRVVRGGSFWSDAHCATPASREGRPVWARLQDVGFRLVCSVRHGREMYNGGGGMW